MNKAIVEVMARHVQRIADEERDFDLDLWLNKTAWHELDAPEEPTCGFTGCFIGWAIHQQWAAPFGLRILPNDQQESDIGAFMVVKEGSEPRFHQFAVDEKARAGWGVFNAISAFAYLLGIDRKTLELIIYSEHYSHVDRDESVPADEVAQRLRELASMGEDDFYAKFGPEADLGEDR